jgi:pyrimidine 5'-nucleotidase
MLYSTILLDLDDTLYERGNGLWDAIRDRMSEYIHIKLNIPIELVPNLRKTYYETYGTTLRGLQIHHHVDADDYLAFVHDLPLSEYIQPDAELVNLLNSLPQRKYIFTNSDAAHAKRVLQILGALECIDGIIDVRALEFACKPEPIAIQKALIIAGVMNPALCIYFDDIANNLTIAKDMGIFTILVGTNQTHPSACLTIKNIKALPEAMPELWDHVKPKI